ncbi:MAG: HPr-rel-A system PqqD family peptide chaperone [Geminicoccaceae bacterium]|nr:HPr-rel-A system PqqD family peptide chaperone [Geminicoccaceae bacterium]
MSGRSVRLSAEFGETLTMRAWAGEAVIYDDMTGDTHFLAEKALRLVRLLEQGEQSVEAIANLLDRDFHPPSPCGSRPLPDLLEQQATGNIHTEAILANLVEIGVAEPCVDGIVRGRS